MIPDAAAQAAEARGLALRVVALTTWRVRMARASVYTTARIKPPADTAREVATLAERGHRFAKLKVGLDVERDVETVRQVRAAVGSGFQLLVDGNGGFAPKAAIAFVRRIEEYGVYLVEQPVR